MSSSEKAVFARNTSDNSKAGVNVDQLEEQSIGSANTTTQLLDTTLSKIGESQNGTTSDDEILARVYKRVKWDSSHKSAKKETSDRRHELTDGLKYVSKCSSDISYKEKENREKAIKCSNLSPIELHEIEQDSGNCSTHSAEMVRENCSFCQDDTCALEYCEDCCVSCCTTCFGAIHSSKGSFKNHMITELRLKGNLICKKHSLPSLFFCETCDVGICTSCMTVKEENKESHRLHAIKKMAEYVEDKKMEIRSSLESTKALVSGLSSMPSTINQHRDIIELDWLLRKETIRQEFVSLHDVLITREQQLLEGMEMEVNKSLNDLTDMEEKHKALCEECTAVTQIFDNLVEEESSSTFLKEVKDLEERCLCIEQTVQWLTFHELVSPPVLRVPFSLHQEKCHLAEVLSFDNICNTDLVVKSPLVYLPYDLVCWESILASEMWYPARAHPSTDVSYNIEFRLAGKHVWTSNIAYEDKVFNASGKPELMFGRSYTLKVTPVYVCTTGAHRKEIYEGRGSTILIVTEDSYEKDPVQRLHSDPSCKYNTSFEEERMRFIESTKDKRLELLKKQQRLQKNNVVTNQIKPKLACFLRITKNYKYSETILP